MAVRGRQLADRTSLDSREPRECSGAASGVSSALTGHRLDQSSSSQTYQMERYEFRLLWRANRFLPRQSAGGLGTRAGGELASRSAKDEDAP